MMSPGIGQIHALVLLRHELLGLGQLDAVAPEDECHTVMPFSNTPEHTRMKASRSRWAGFMLA